MITEKQALTEEHPATTLGGVPWEEHLKNMQKADAIVARMSSLNDKQVDLKQLEENARIDIFYELRNFS